MRILFAAAGTGGHITPALTVAEELLSRGDAVTVAFAGTENGMERELVKKAGYRFYPMAMQGFRRRLSLYNLKTLYCLMRSPWAAGRILDDFRPSLVMGTGGYVSYPLLKAAKKRGILTCLHEANAVPGLSVRMTERYTDRLFLHFDAVRALLKHPERAMTVGMPTPVAAHASREAMRRRYGIPEDAFLLLSFGGSLGAEAMNTAMLTLFQGEKIKRDARMYAVHATGKKHYEDFINRAGGALPARIQIVPYLDGVPSWMAAADLVVSRAGAATLAELSGAGRASLLIPSPYVTDDHQRKNAAAFVKRGAALLLEEEALPAELERRIFSVRGDPALRRKMEKAARTLATPNAARRIADEIFRMIDASKCK